MIRKLLLALFMCISISAMTQTAFISENFEGTALSMTSISNGTTNWALSSNLFSQGSKSDTCVLSLNDTVYLESSVFSTIGSPIVYFEFAQICKIEFFDKALVEVSIDNGLTWTALSTSEYLGQGVLFLNGFNEASYPTVWGLSAGSIPNNQWWKNEKFDISSIAANKSQVKIRFTIIDANANGINGYYGWLLDDIKVWRPYNQEAKAISYYMPFALPSGCGLSNEVVQFTIANVGSANFSGNLTASFQREGQAVVTENISSQVNMYDTITYTFSNKIDLSTFQDTVYEVKVWVNLANDSLNTNDTIIDNVISRVALAMPQANDTTISYGTNVKLHATHTDSIKWYSDPLAQNQIQYGQYYTTPILYDTTVYYAQAGGVALDEITTTFASGHASDGNMFDIQAINTITIDSFDINGSTDTIIEVWYRSGSYVGHTTSNSGWTKLGEDTVVNAVQGNPTRLPIGGLTIPAGQTYGICVTYLSGSLKYTLGDGTNQVYQDENLKFIGGVGGAYFNYTFSPRVWNGTIYYHSGNGAVGSCPSPMKKVTVNVNNIPVNNAALTTISPEGNMLVGAAPIKVSLMNDGIDTLKKCKIYYSVNDSIYPVFLWTGSLLKDSSEFVTLTNFAFGSGIYKIKAWTSMPNDSVDLANHNDTISSFVSICLSGSFTLGGPTADIADFATLQALLDTMGLCGQTTINILPGTYTEQLVLGNINGASDSTRLIFQSSTGNPADVIIQYTPTTSAAAYVIKLTGTQYVTFKKLTVKALGTSSYAHVFYLTDNCRYVELDSNIIQTYGSSSSKVIYIYGGAPSKFNTITNNVIHGGSYGVYIKATSTSLMGKGTTISNNIFTNSKVYVIYGYYEKKLKIEHNTMTNNPLSENIYGARLSYCDQVHVVGNNMKLTGTRNVYGAYMYKCDSLTTGRSLFANNMIMTSGLGSYPHYGIYQYRGKGMDIVYNSIYNENGSSDNRMIWINNNSSAYVQDAIYNNSIYNLGGGYNLDVSSNSRLKGADNNNIYGPNANTFAYFGTNYTSLAALKAGDPNNNQNTISVNPQYISTSDLHTNSVILNAAGKPMYDIVNIDIDGMVRDSLTPDIGADEYIVITNDAGIESLVSPQFSCIGDTANIIVKLKSFGTDTLFSCTVNWSVNGVAQTPVVINDTVLFYQTTNVSLGTYVFANGNVQNIAFWTSSPNSVADLNTTNDSLALTFRTSLSGGTYTVGGSNPDFLNLNEVANELNQYGICGPVVFNIASGTYNEQFSLNNIVGISTVNTITIQSATNDSSDVVLSYNASSANSNFVINLNATNNIIIKDLTIQAINANFSNAIILANTANNIEISNCVIKNTSHYIGTISLDERNLIHTKDSIGDNINIHNNNFYYGNSAILMFGGNTPKSGWNISNNVFNFNAKNAIKISLAEAVIIDNNEIINSSVVIADFNAISVTQSEDSIRITKNRINIGGTADCQGILVNNCIGNAVTPILIANNFISINQISASTWASGIQASATKHINIYHNNVMLTGGYANSSAIYVNNTSSSQTDNLFIKNNVFATAISGGSIYKFINCSNTTYENDYNVLYNAVSGKISDAITTLSAWQSNSGDALHSFIINPYFTSNSDLHVSNNLLNGVAIVVPEVIDDIDGQARNTTSPDIGADEFDPSPYDITVLSILTPSSSCGLDTNETISILIKNIGTASVSSGLSVAYQWPGMTNPVIETINNTLLTGDTLVYSFTNKANFDVSSFGNDSLFAIKAWSMLATDLSKINDTSSLNLNSYYTPITPVSANVVGAYGTSSTLSTTSSFTVSWFDSLTSTTPIGTGLTYQTPLLYDTTQYWLSASTAHCVSPRSTVFVNTTGYPLIDAGISSIVSPSGSVQYNTSQVLQVALNNYGTSNLTTAKIFWSIDGVVDSMLWAGTLINNDVDTVDLDTLAFSGGVYNFRAWSSIPNGIADTININDTTSILTFNVCLSGNYSIGDTVGGGNYDFPSFTSAVSELVAGGICGPVTFLVDSRLYEEKVIFPSINGVGTNARITFTSLSGDSTDVKLHYTTSATVAWAMKIKGDYYTFSHMTLSSYGGSTYGRVMELADGATHNEILNCVVEGVSVTSSSTKYSVIYSNGGGNQYNTIKNNLILNGSYSLYFNGYSNNTQKGNVIEGNIIKDFYYYGPSMYYQKYLHFNSNYIENGPSSSVYGLRLRYCDQIEVTKNTINVTGSSSHRGVYMYYCDGSSTNPNLFANNFVIVTGGSSSTGYAFYNYGSTYTNFYNNSIHQSSGNSSVASFYTYSGTHLNVLNNVFSNTGGGYAYYLGTLGSIVSSDYNDIYATGSKLAYYQGGKTTLAAFQSATSKDQYSMDVNPMFISSTDLHSNSIDLNGAAQVLSSVIDDIDGEIRSPYTPDIGADEFLIPLNDASISQIVSPVSPITPGVSNIFVNIKSLGIDTLESVTIAWEVNSVPQTSYSWTGAITYGNTSNSVNIGSYNFNAGNNYLKVWTVNPNNLLDENNLNDTVEVILVGCTGPLSGNYTIGGTSADYPTINDAILILNNCGVDSHVVFNIAPGVYNEQLELTEVTGAADTATICFQSSTLDSTDVTIAYNSSISDNYTVLMNGADWIRFKHLTIDAINSVNGKALVFENISTHNVFESNIIKGGAGTTSSSAAIYSDDDNDSYNSFRYNHIMNGYYSVYMEGESGSSLENGLVFEYNVISGYHEYGVYIYYSNNLDFNHNTISNGVSSTYGYAVYLDNCDGAMQIYNNKININTSGFHYGLRLVDCEASASAHSRIYNNFFSVVTTSGSSKGFYGNNITYQDFTNNNILVKSSHPAARGLYIVSGSNNRVLNNNIMIDSSGHAYYVDDASALIESNYNNIFSKDQFGYYGNSNVASLSALQLASGMDSNSVSTNPEYNSVFDLHVSAVTLNSNALPINWIVDDFDGQIRNLNYPDIGADEFTPPALDIAIIEFIKPIKNFILEGDSQKVVVKIKNFGADTLHSLNISYKYSNNQVITQTWNGTLLPDDTTNMLFTTQLIAQIGTEDLCAYVTLIGDTNAQNDTICMGFTGMPLIVPSHCDDFETVNIWATPESEWQHGNPQNTTINSAYSGNMVWMTQLTSNYNNYRNEYLYSPYYDFSNVMNGSTLKFQRNNKFASNDGFTIEYSNNGGASWLPIGYVGDTLGTNWYNGQNGGVYMFINSTSSWLQSTYDLSQFNQATVPIQFRFRFTSNYSGTDEGVAIDDFCIKANPFPNDVGVVSIDAPVDSLQAGSLNNQISISVKNFGTLTQTTIPLSYKIGNNLAITDTLNIPAGLAFDSVAQFTFSQQFQCPVTDFDICAYTSLSTDGNILNNQKCKNIIVYAANRDASVTMIISPNDSTSLYVPQEVSVRIKNIGLTPFSICDVQYNINNGTPIIETWSGQALNHGDSIDFTFITKYNSLIGNYQLCAKSILQNDDIPSNDEICENLLGTIGIDKYDNSKFILFQNVPNPTSGISIVMYEIPSSGQIRFSLTNTFGQSILLIEKKVVAGKHEISIDANSLKAGIYYYTLEFDSYRITKKMIVNH